MLLISLSINWDHPDKLRHVFTLFVMNHRLQQMHPCYNRLCWMIPDLSSESKPFLLHAGKQKRTHILSRQIFLPRREELSPNLSVYFPKFIVLSLSCQRGLTGRDNERLRVSHQWISLHVEDNIRRESQVFLPHPSKASEHQSLYIRDKFGISHKGCLSRKQRIRLGSQLLCF